MRPALRAGALLTLAALTGGPITPSAREVPGSVEGPRPTPGFYAPTDLPSPGLFAPTGPTPHFFAPTALPGARQYTEPCQRRVETTPRGYEYYFTRGVYSDGGRGRGFFGRGRGGRNWATDFPKADQQFLIVVQRLANLGSYMCENAVSLEDPELRRYPFLYILEVGSMSLTDAELEGLRGYLMAGGFLVVDDFWGDWEWDTFESEITRVLPEFPIVDLPMEHELFTTFYDIEEILQVPSINNAMGGWYSECGPCRPFVKGIFDQEGRLIVVINGNTDLGDAWEWAERPEYPLDYSTYAYEMGVNMIVYSMSH